MDCLIAIGPFATIAGVLFLHDIKKDRVTAGLTSLPVRNSNVFGIMLSIHLYTMAILKLE